MNDPIGTQRKTPASAATLPGTVKPHSTGNYKMQSMPKPTNLQILKPRTIYFPNKKQSPYPHSVRIIEARFKLPPHHANLIAELQGYQLGGA